MAATLWLQPVDLRPLGGGVQGAELYREPAIIISASGMAEAGRILHHLKNNVEDPRSTVLIVGWQAPDTLGRRLVEHQPVVKIFGEEYHVKAQVVTINGFSAHADRAELVDTPASWSVLT